MQTASQPQRPGEIPQVAVAVRMRRGTIRFWLISLVAACVVPAIAAAALVTVYSYARERATIKEQTIDVTRALTQAVDRELASAKAALSALATSPYLVSGDLASFHAQAREVLLAQAGNGIVLADASGQQVMSTIVPYGEKLPRSGVPDLLRVIVASAKPSTSDFYVGATSKKPQVGVGVPVLRDGKVVYGLIMGILPERLADILRDQRLPSSWVAGILDSKGTIVARTHDPDQFVGKKGSPALVQKMAEVREGTLDSTTLEGIPVLAGFSRSDVSGWSVAIGIPLADLTAGLRQSVWLIATGASVLLVLIGLLVTFIGRRIVRSIRSLQDPALALLDGRSISLQPTNVVEVDEVAQALSTASREREKLIREKEQMEAHLRRSQRLEALGQLTGSVAHDFGNLLTPIIGMLDLVAKQPDNPRVPSYLGTARSAADRAAKLVQSLLAFAHQQPLVMASININAVVRNMKDLLNQTIRHKAKLELELELEPEAWPVRADISQLEMAILNLVVNARDAIAEDGNVRISTTNVSVHDEIDGLAGDFVALTVSDTGSGMPPEVLARAFEPLFTTKPPGKGTGLGLSSLYGFAKQCGGTAAIDSELGRGTAVTIYLPREAQEAARRNARSDESLLTGTARHA